VLHVKRVGSFQQETHGPSADEVRNVAEMLCGRNGTKGEHVEARQVTTVNLDTIDGHQDGRSDEDAAGEEDDEHLEEADEEMRVETVLGDELVLIGAKNELG
jgi:hypothetical protein